MEKGTHGVDEKRFSELDYAGQSRVINAQILVIEKSINAHITDADKFGKDKETVKRKCISLLNNLLEKIPN